METNILEPLRETKKHTIYTPFGPCVGYKKLSKELVRKLNKCCDDHDKGKKVMESHADYLIGKVAEEPTMPPDLASQVLNETHDFMTEYMVVTKSRDIKKDVHFKENIITHFESNSAWFVRQYENEYNPIHNHTGCEISGVIYLKVPDVKGRRNLQSKKGKMDSDGDISFVYCTASQRNHDIFEKGLVQITPVPGLMLMFPSYLGHTVYPFVGEGERRCIGFNANYRITDQSDSSVGSQMIAGNLYGLKNKYFYFGEKPNE